MFMIFKESYTGIPVHSGHTLSVNLIKCAGLLINNGNNNNIVVYFILVN